MLWSLTCIAAVLIADAYVQQQRRRYSLDWATFEVLVLQQKHRARRVSANLWVVGDLTVTRDGGQVVTWKPGEGEPRSVITGRMGATGWQILCKKP